MNWRQRNANRRTARLLREHVKSLHVCENCGERGAHWVHTPVSIAGLMTGEPSGFWICPKLYDADGRRLPEHTDPAMADPLPMAFAALAALAQPQSQPLYGAEGGDHEER